jgi:hypothetical protein
VLVVDRGGGAGQVVDPVHLESDRLDHVVADQLEAPGPQQVLDVPAPAGEEVVQAEDLVSLTEQPLAEVGPEKARSSRHQNSHIFALPV